MESAVKRFSEVIENRLGLYFDDARSGFLSEVLQRRSQKGSGSVESYLHRLQSEASEEELAILASELTVGETYFFRNNDQFRALTESVVPELMNRGSGNGPLKILSAGCASGEEAYSLAMAVHDLAKNDREIVLTAVDVNPRVLEKAAGGRFSTWALRETPGSMLQRWFRKESEDFVLDERIRRAVRFERHNLALPSAQLWQQPAYDVVFCRNLMMYFSRENAQTLVDRIASLMTPGGYLFLGHAETLRGLSERFHLCHTHETFYYRLKDDCEATVIIEPILREEAQPSSAAESWIEAVHSAGERIRNLAEGRRDESRATPARGPKGKLKWDLTAVLDLLRAERFADALEWVRRLPAESGADPAVLLLRAVLLAHSGQLDLAEESCHALLAIEEMNAGAHYLLALCREGRGDAGSAAEHDRTAIYLDPGFAMPRLHLGLLARRRGERRMAREQLGHALTLLHQEETARLLLFGGGFSRGTLMTLCREGLAACGETI